MAAVEKTDDTLAKLVKNFDSWLDQTEDARTEAASMRDYFDGYQWSETEITTLEKRKQPPITDNKIQDKVNYLIGLEIATRTDPKAFPRTPQHEQDAEAITDALRFVGDSQDFNQIRSDVAENVMVEGDGGAEVYVKQSKAGVDVCIKRNRWERRYYDPYSSERDFSDARFLGTFVWMDIEAAKEKWPDLKDVWEVATAEMGSTPSSTDDDRPVKLGHYDTARRRVRVLEQYYLEGGQWKRAKFVKGGFIEQPEVSPYLDDEGSPEHPYVWISAYVDQENQRYGVVRRWKSLQDEINHRRSKSLHLLNNRQTIYEDGAIDDPEKWRLEMAKPDGMLKKTPGMEVEVSQNLDLSVGHFNLLQQATEALSILGPKAPTNVSPSQSGRAKQLDRQSDALELGRLFDQLRHFQKMVYRKVWHRVKQHWTEEKWVRIRDDEGAPKFVRLNAPITAQEAAQAAQAQGLPVPPQLAWMAQVTPQRAVAKRNDVAQLDVDIVIDEVPDVINLQQEQFEQLVTLAQAGVVLPPDVYIDASQLRNKKQIKEKLTGGDDPEAQAAAQAQQEMQIRAANAKIAKDEAAAGKTQAEADQTNIENIAAGAALHGMATG